MKQITWFIFPEWKYQNLGTMQTLLGTPIKLTTSGRGKLTTYFAGEDFAFMHVR